MSEVAASGRLIIVGVDAGDRNLILNWAEEGALPTLAGLMQESLWGDSSNPTGMVAGTVWPTFYTGVLPGRTGRFRGTTQFVSGTYEHADIDLPRDEFPPFWDVLSNAGRDSVVVDAPYAFLSTKERVTQLVDWCSHSAWKDGHTVSKPASFSSDVVGRYGIDPIGKCDFATLNTLSDFQKFRDRLIDRIETRKRFMLELLDGRDDPLLFQVFSECHCAGHQLWHLHDEQHPLHDRELAEALGGDPLKDVYQGLDAALAELKAALGPNDRLLVLCSHGIGPAYTGTHLLDEVLLKLEGRESPKRRQGLAQNMVATWTYVPRPLRALLTPLQKLLWPKLKANLVQPGKANRKFFEVIVNDCTAGVRINLRGREPSGTVAPGEEYEALCSMLETEIAALEDPQTGRPLVTRIIRTSSLYPGDRSDRLPDLLVLWHRGGPITEARSEAVGHVSHRFVFKNHRTGDHTEDDGLFFLSGEGVPATRLGAISVADLPPTITAMLGVELEGTDGRLIPEMLPAQPPTAVPIEAG